MQLNPYESPPPGYTRPKKPTPPPGSTFTRTMSAALAMFGSIFLIPAMVFCVFWPGVLVWICWLLIAMNQRWLDHPMFWTYSLFWNSLMVAWLSYTIWWQYTGGPHWDRASAFMIGHSTVACIVSVISIVITYRQPRTFSRASHDRRS
ncbi:hypothetical protein [Stieleria varia]|uniref:Uncharacterized protein n=1 Tax=Stieleria varia TaxID=2528005 RepID=A0A5C6AQ80_9BACT|nr:hypothetical protein [Stieleria varia]TWU01236.1 hypothetical protein Pla52n_46090 [Stieleria varia]